MKKILVLVLGVTLLSLSSCFQLDNWDEPDCTWSGTVTDSYTQQPLASSQNDWQMRIWERSYKGQEGGATNFQDLRIKQDGTYQNTKLFAGTYDMLPYNGPFWPMDTIKSLVLGKNLVHNFEVTPYVQIVGFSAELYKNAGKDSIRFKFKVKAPVLEKNGRTLPRLWRLRAFLSLTQFCGGGTDSAIGDQYTNNQAIDNFNDLTVANTRGVQVTLNDNGNNSWATLIANGPGDNTTREIILSTRVNAEYTYNVRVGAAVNDTHQKYCYSDIKTFTVPK